jgi:hypothetical protein
MPLLSESFLEMVLTAAVPDVAGAGTGAGAVQHPYRSPAHAAIGVAVDDARRTGRRAAVCVVDVPAGTAAQRPSAAMIHADVARTLRPGDHAVRLGEAIVIVASGFDHPAAADRLADRLRAAPLVRDHDAAVGMALYPVHGRDAATLLDSARASALRARLRLGIPATESGVTRRVPS